MTAQTDLGATRLDAFVDAAFAFALTLLVIGGGAAPESYDALQAAIRRIPAFLVGFALIGMFWHGHVRWRRYGGGGSLLSVFVSFALVFLVLVYVYPLRLMAVSLIDWLAGTAGGSITRDQLGGLFTIYGLGFASMSSAMLLLFVDGRRRAPAASRHGMSGEIGVWSILLAAGVLSALAAQFPAIAPFAAFAYAPIGVVIPLYSAWFWRRPAR